jgi:uncharacterized protein YjbI with pentapeptide repeats
MGVETTSPFGEESLHLHYTKNLCFPIRKTQHYYIVIEAKMKHTQTLDIYGTTLFSSSPKSTADLVLEAYTSKVPLVQANLSGEDLSGLNLKGIDLKFADLSNSNMEGIDLKFADLSRADLSNANLIDANLTEANLIDANLNDANLTGANLTGADLTGADLNDADLTDADLTDANLTDANLTNANLTNAKLVNTNRVNTNLNTRVSSTNACSMVNQTTIICKSVGTTPAEAVNTELELVDVYGETIFKEEASSFRDLVKKALVLASSKQISLNRVNLSGTDLSELDFTGLDLMGADLSKSNLYESILANVNLFESNLTSANLNKVNLTRSNLSRASLSGCTLLDSNLTSADLSDVNLSGANLSGSISVGSIFCKADLTEANLSNTNLAGSNMFRANLTRANLTNANLRLTDLRQCNLSESNMVEADLFGSTLVQANLTDSDLTYANLATANLTSAYLTGAKLTWTNLDSADLTKTVFSKEPKEFKNEPIEVPANFMDVGDSESPSCNYAQIQHSMRVRWGRDKVLPGDSNSPKMTVFFPVGVSTTELIVPVASLNKEKMVALLINTLPKKQEWFISYLREAPSKNLVSFITERSKRQNGELDSNITLLGFQSHLYECGTLNTDMDYSKKFMCTYLGMAEVEIEETLASLYNHAILLFPCLGEPKNLGVTKVHNTVKCKI